VTDDGKLPCSEVCPGVQNGVISDQKVKNQAVLEGSLEIIALLRCLFGNRKVAFRASQLMHRWAVGCRE